MLTQLRTLIVQTPTYLTILTGVLLIGYQYVFGIIPLSAQFVGCLVLLLASGIPHGALDHLIEQQRSIHSNQPFSMLFFMVKYLLLIAVYGLGWLVSPVLSLVVFLVISAWHFGETDLDNVPDTIYWALARFTAGGLLLAFILLTHSAEVTPIVARIVEQDRLAMQVWAFLDTHATTVLIGHATLLLILIGLASWHRPAFIGGWRLFRLAVVVVLTYPLPLLPAFILYFCGWHALSSFGTIQTYLKLPAYSLRSAWVLWGQAMPLTIAAFVFLAGCTFVWYKYVPTLDPVPCLFVLLSIITLPHIRVMHHINKVVK